VNYQLYRLSPLGWHRLGGPVDAAEAIARLHYALATGKRLRVEGPYR